METTMELTPDQKMEMSLEEIIWHNKMLNNERGPGSTRSQTHSVKSFGSNSNRVPVYYYKNRFPRNRYIGQCSNRCAHGGYRFNFPLYRTKVRNAVRTLLSRPQQAFRFYPSMASRMNRMKNLGISVSNDNYLNKNYNNMSRNNFLNNQHVTNRRDGVIRFKRSFPNHDYFNYNVKKFSDGFFIGGKVIVDRHSINRKLNVRIQAELNRLSLGKNSRARLYNDLDFCPMPHTTSLLLTERFTFNG